MTSDPNVSRSEDGSETSPLELSADDRAELLDPAAWNDALDRYAQSTRLAVALTDSSSHLLLGCFNAQSVWSMARTAVPLRDGDCPFCLNRTHPCTAATESLRSGKLVFATDRAKMVHVAVPLLLDGVELGVLLAGQVFEQFPEQLPVERAAREFGISSQLLWQTARKQRPFGRDRLQMCGDLLATLGQSIVKARYGAITERRQTQKVTALGRDIFEHRRLAAEAQESRQFFHATIDALSSHIAVLDEQGIILAVNAAWRRFAEENNYRGQNYGVGSRYIEQCEPHTGGCAEGESVAAGLSDVLEGRRDHFQLEYSCHSLNERRWFIMRATRFLALGPVRVVVSHENITERKLAEESLREADRRKVEFLAMLGHELRNPLAPIRNAVQVLRRSGQAATAADVTTAATEMIDRHVGHMVRLVDDLLDVSRINRGKIELKKERTKLESAVHHAVEAIRPLAENMGHELNVTLPPEPLYVDADPARLAQIIGNLLTNACKYSERGGHVRLTVERDGDHAVVCVRDRGMGLAADQLTRIFDMFAQVNAGLERSQGGLGIGLGLVKNLVEMHGGTVEASSDGPGKGATFTIRLPLATTPACASSPEPPNGAGPTAKSRRILIVDDNRDAAESLAILLSLSGNETYTAHDGIEAVEMTEKVRPQVVLLDIGLPKLNGYDAACRIRQLSGGKDLVLVALTGWGQEEDRRRSQESGFNMHMVKPVDLKVLASFLKDL